MRTPNPAIAETFCYAQCRAYTVLNHTDAKALVCVLASAAFALVWFSEVQIFNQSKMIAICRLNAFLEN